MTPARSSFLAVPIVEAGWKMRKKLLVLIAVVVLLLRFLGATNNHLSAWLVPIIGDGMDWHSKWLMGRHGIDCGRVKARGDPIPATKCALEANSQAKPFRVRYDIMGYDSVVAGGIVRTADQV